MVRVKEDIANGTYPFKRPAEPAPFRPASNVEVIGVIDVLESKYDKHSERIEKLELTVENLLKICEAQSTFIKELQKQNLENKTIDKPANDLYNVWVNKSPSQPVVKPAVPSYDAEKELANILTEEIARETSKQNSYDKNKDLYHKFSLLLTKK